MEYKDYYGTLGIKKGASQAEIQRAYRALARKYHPDVNKEPESEERFKSIGEAYEVLKDSDKRARYDQYGSAWNTAQETGGVPPGWESFHFDVGGNAAGFDFGRGASGHSSFFEMLFGNQAGQGGGYSGAFRDQSQRSRRGQDLETRLSLSLEETVSGGQRQVALVDPLTGQRRTLSVKIPKGVRGGQRIRLAGQGGPGSNGGPSGNIYLMVELLPHPRFSVDGADLHTNLEVAPWEAALGGEAEIQTLEGSVKVKIPAGFSSGRKIRLRGRGLPQLDGQAGDFYAEIKIVVPNVLTPRQRELYEQLAQASRSEPVGKGNGAQQPK